MNTQKDENTLETSEVSSGPNPIVAAIIIGALGVVVGAVAGVFSLGLFIDGMIIGGTRVSQGGQVLTCAMIGGALGAFVGGGIAYAKRKSK